MATSVLPKKRVRFRFGMSQRKAMLGLLYVSPWVIGYVALNFIPNLTSLYYSMTEWDFFSEPTWVGLRNYAELLRDPVFMLSLRNTVLIMVFSNLITIGFGLIAAAIMAKDPPGRYLFRTVLYLPSLVMPVAFGMMMRQIYASGDYGLLNQFLGLFGVPPQQWLADERLAVWAVIIAAFWGIGGTMVIFLAGIKGISRAYYEAAMIDGANAVQQFFRITLPLLFPVIVFQTIMGVIGSSGLQVFDFPASLAEFSGSGSSMGQNNSLGTLVYYLYIKGFRYLEFGQASAIAWFVFGIALVLGIIIWKLSKRYDFYGTES